MFTIKTKLYIGIYFSIDNTNHGNYSNWPFDLVAQENVPLDALPLKSVVLGNIMNHAISDAIESRKNRPQGPNIDEGLLIKALIKVRKKQKEFWNKHG